MSEKIKAIFGADVSEVEAKMLIATRATKAYENAVKGLAKNAAPASTPMDGMASKIPQIVEAIRGLNGDLGQSVASVAKLASGFGAMAMGIGAAVVVGNQLKEWIEGSTKKFDEMIQKSSDIQKQINSTVSAQEKLGQSDEERLAIAKENLKQKELDWKVSVKMGDDNDKIAAAVLEKEKAKLEVMQLQQAADAKSKAFKDSENKKKNELREEKEKYEFSRLSDDEKLKRLQHFIDIDSRTVSQGIDADKARFEAKKQMDAILDKRKAEQAAAAEQAARKEESNLNKQVEKQKEIRAEVKKTKELTEEKADILATGGRTRNEKGQLMRRGVVISAEDAARSDITKAQAAKNAGQISAEEHKKLLSDIRDALKPTQRKT